MEGGGGTRGGRKAGAGKAGEAPAWRSGWLNGAFHILDTCRRSRRIVAFMRNIQWETPRTVLTMKRPKAILAGFCGDGIRAMRCVPVNDATSEVSDKRASMMGGISVPSRS